MNEYDDDDGGYDDRPPPRGGDRLIEEAKRRTYLPAIFLIITGGISLCMTIYGFIALPSFDKNMEAQIKLIEDNPGIPADQKKMQVDMMRSIADGIKPFMLPLYVVGTAVGLLTVFGGIKMMNLQGRGLVIAGSILSMIPITSGCCCLGLPFGIWALVVLNNPVVRDGYRAVAGGSRAEDY